MQFDDYHRTVIGYHGTRLSVARDIVNRRGTFQPSRNGYDWLGHGIYFWEYAPWQALSWAQRQKMRQGWDEPIAILGSMIRLGFCFDLLDPYNVKYLKEISVEYVQTEEEAGRTIQDNANHLKYLDSAIFQYAYAVIAASDGMRPVDSARAVYVPTGQNGRLWKRSWISSDAHIQICVRNPACILGTWLHYSADLENSHGHESTQIAKDHIQPEDQAGSQKTEGDGIEGAHPAPG